MRNYLRLVWATLSPSFPIDKATNLQPGEARFTGLCLGPFFFGFARIIDNGKQ